MDTSSFHSVQSSPVSSSLARMDVDMNINAKDNRQSTIPAPTLAQAQAQIQTEKGREKTKGVAMTRLSVKALRTSSKRNFVSYDSEPICLSNATPEDTDPNTNGENGNARNALMTNKHHHHHQHHYRNVRDAVFSEDRQLYSDYSANERREEDNDEDDDNDDEENENDSIAIGRRHANLGGGTRGEISAFDYDAPRDSQISLIREFADADTQDKNETAKGKRETRVQPNQDMFSVLQHAKSTPPKTCSSPSSEKALTSSKDSQIHFGNLDGRCRGETGDLEGIVPLRNGRMGISNPPSRSGAEPTWLDLHRAKKRRGLQSLSLKNIMKLK